MTHDEAHAKAIELLNPHDAVDAGTYEEWLYNITAALIAAHNDALEEAAFGHDVMIAKWRGVKLKAASPTEANGMIDLHERYAAAIRARKIT